MYHIWVDNRDFYQKPHASLAHVSPDGWPCFYHRDIKSINNSESTIVVIDNHDEGIHSKPFFDLYPADRKYLIISNGWWDKQHYDFPFEYELVYYPFFLLTLVNTYLSPFHFNFYMDKEYDFDCNKSHTFVSIIGKSRSERGYLVNQLMSKLSYSDYILRYHGQDYGEPCHSDVATFTEKRFNPEEHIVKKYFHTPSQNLPIDVYNQCCFKLLVETGVTWQHEFFMTEKTIKCLISGIPFVMVSTPRFLHHLRQHGFTTYHDLWDESYDDELEFEKRVEKIIQLCESLKNFDWVKNRDRLRLIAMKNRNNLFKLNQHFDRTFRDFERALIALDQ